MAVWLNNPWMWAALAGLLVVTFWDSIKPTWRPAPVDPLVPDPVPRPLPKPIAPVDTLTDEAKQFIERRKRIEADIVALEAEKVKLTADIDAKIASKKADIAQGELLINTKPEVTP